MISFATVLRRRWLSLALHRTALLALGLVGLGSLATPAARAMDFNVVPMQLPRCGDNCPAVITATGEITHTDPEVFVDFVRRQLGQRRLSSIVFLHSPGGNVAGAIQLGMILRRLKMTTVIGQVRPGSVTTGDCHSACVYTLMGGVKRVVPEGSRVGVHRMVSRAIPQRDVLTGGSIDPVRDPNQMLAFLRRYVASMGVNPGIVALSEGTPNESIRVLTRAELARFRLARGKL